MAVSREFRRARRTFRFEQLELRWLMATDLASSALPLSATELSESETVATANAAGSTDSLVVPTRSRTRLTPTMPAPVRTFDGTSNNLATPELGSTNEQLLRVAAAEYADGISTMGGIDRPSPRDISNLLAAQDENAAPNDRNLSAFIYIWGQFLDHDIDLTESSVTNPERAPVPVPIGDIQFDPDGTGQQVIPFTRSVFDPATGTSVDNPRQQINQITSWIDGSMVYGSSQQTADRLRTFSGGRLIESEGGLPPQDAQGFIAGDIRANENIELTSMHALFIREHNRLADQLAKENPRWTDEQIYQQARALVIAEIQVITYKEFLPALLGRGAIAPYRGYDPTIDPSIANEFSTAAFRLHTLINDDVEFFGNDGRAVREEVELREAFFNPDLLRETGIDSILKYAASTQAQEVDNQIVDGLRNFLFSTSGSGGLDLASLNIQRGRDHGLADYNAVRRAYGLAAVTTFADITSDQALALKLESVYGSVDNIDLWVGLLAEDHLAGSSLGETSQTIISDQFERLRDGDRFWYQNIFAGKALSQLERTTLSDVIQRNTTVNNLQGNVFFMQAEIAGQVFIDANFNNRQDRREIALSGVTVELLDDAGGVIESTVTDRSGRYRFSQFAETGLYQVRIVPPAGTTAATSARDVLISRGGLNIRNVNFGLQQDQVGNAFQGRTLRGPLARTDIAAATDAAIEANTSIDVLNRADSLGLNRMRSRTRR